MTDRELLELAAKAAGYDYECTSHTGRPENDQHQIRDWFGMLVDWNPLEDDGDALRLAVTLGLHLFQSKHYVRCGRKTIDMPIEESKREQDPNAATRRAIVRAAAVLGETK